MKNAILVPGRPDKDEYYNPIYPSNSNNHWFPWLSKQLQIKDIFAVAIELPEPWKPRYNIWKKEFERFDISSNTVLVGHSCGAGFLIRWLSENKQVSVAKVILVAPWINPDNNAISDTADFFEFEIDQNFPERTCGINVLYSVDDEESVLDTVKILKSRVKNIIYQEFTNKGHFTLNSLGTEEFPELLEEILK